MKTQRRGFLGGEYDAQAIYAELDYLHQVLNQLGFPEEVITFSDYNASVFDQRIACKRSGLTIRLPSLGKEDDGWTVFIKDKSGAAASSNISILPSTGKTIDASTSVSISTNYGYKKIQWDFRDDRFYEIV